MLKLSEFREVTKDIEDADIEIVCDNQTMTPDRIDISIHETRFIATEPVGGKVLTGARREAHARRVVKLTIYTGRLA